MQSIKYIIEKYFIYDKSYLSIDTVANKFSNSKEDIVELVYGETYDQYGLTLDSLKYYFFIALLENYLISKGKNVSSTIIIGDLHSIKNKIVQNKNVLLSEAGNRIELIKKIKNIYGLNIKPVLMSEKFNDDNFKKNLKIVTNFFENSPKLQEIAKKTVLKNRISQEESLGFQYTLEEVSLIIDYNVKIGPPREIHYDQITNIIKKELKNQEFIGIYLKPTYPLGVGFDFYIRHPEIEKFGLTPYKAGSNKLQDNRIILEDHPGKSAEFLINSSFISTNSLIPNPVLDIYLISQMAESFLKNEQFCIDEELINKPELLKKIAFEKFKKNILKPLNIN